MPQNRYRDPQPTTKEQKSCQHVGLGLISFPHLLTESQQNWFKHKEYTEELGGPSDWEEITLTVHVIRNMVFLESGAALRKWPIPTWKGDLYTASKKFLTESNVCP